VSDFEVEEEKANFGESWRRKSRLFPFSEEAAHDLVDASRGVPRLMGRLLARLEWESFRVVESPFDLRWTV
jgi:Holliday junction resolvasome RuvABC ATP-dependent DNA helicase subunit